MEYTTGFFVKEHPPPQLAYPLCDLFNASLNSCAAPSSWKISNVCPIFKGGDPSIPSNYRLVSLLNTVEKVLEKNIFNHVFCLSCNLIFLLRFNLVLCLGIPQLTSHCNFITIFVKLWTTDMSIAWYF